MEKISLYKAIFLHFRVPCSFSYFRPHACKRSNGSLSVQLANLTRDLFPLVVLGISQSLEEAEPGDERRVELVTVFDRAPSRL